MIGYYVHHHGNGHRHRALAIAREIDDDVVFFGSAPMDPGAAGAFVRMPPDNVHGRHDRTAGGVLHFAPDDSAGYRERMALLARWVGDTSPAAFVTDVSVEIAVLVRALGIPVVTIAQPGIRVDPPHLTGYALSARVLGPWPAEARPLTANLRPGSFRAVGAISRFAVGEAGHRSGGIVVLTGAGGTGESALVRAADALARGRTRLPVTVLAGADSATVEAALRSASVVVSHCGQGAVAEIAACRVPAVLVPDDRPFGEQDATARVLEEGAFPCRVVDPDGLDDVDWDVLVDEAGVLDGDGWAAWCDGRGAQRAAAEIEAIASGGDAAALVRSAAGVVA